MTAPPDKLTPRQQTAAEVLAAGARLETAAAAAKVSPRTLRRWRLLAPFSAAVREARQASLEEARSLLRTAALDAVRALQEVVRDGESPPAARVAAARVVLQLAEEQDLDERLAVLEQQARDAGAGLGPGAG